MPYTWNRQPTGDDETRDARGESNLVRWVAAGPLTPKEALDDANFPIAFNDPHPDYGSSDRRRCDRVRVVASNFRVVSVDATFSVPEDGFEHQPENPDETHPIVLNWSTIQENVAIDRDRDGNPLLTSAYRGVQGITQPRNYKRLVLTRWESSYVYADSAIENHVNSATFLGGAAGTVKCPIIQPSTSFTSGSLLIPKDYYFDFKAVSVWGEQPWQTQFLDQDSYGYIAGPKRVRIVTANGEPVTDVPLDGTGRPIDASMSYFENPADVSPKASPSWSAQTTPTGATVIPAGSLKMLRYNTLPEADFNSLGF